ncbi:hypothetical protein [Porphyrobacter sp. LM 6]|uniref:hypothetical protein n=1 Tax=Porphyrobacter sp. LM 6 TaxID=1896196 RepID=UPI00086391E6|nr:hypothetical protein [Porphyrobacter sp. LM 6]AOL92993.1 hypothetical protein BG023_1134 [Porphyrobacter sp. LM 6]
MHRLISCLLALLLSGCWTSERPEIAAELLSQPPGLPGRYWIVSRDDGAGSPQLIEFRRHGEGSMIGDAAGKSGSGTFRLTATSLPGVYLKILDNNETSVLYGFMEHRDFGAWQDYGIAAVDDDVFAGPNLAWMQTIADRYELTINASDPEETSIEGKIHGRSIPSLFADPDFLATLEVVSGELFLPAPPAPEEREELFPAGDLSLTLEIEQPDLPGAQWVAPPGLGESYLETTFEGLGARPYGVRFIRQPDGRFELRAMEVEDTNHRPQSLGFLPLEGVDKQYLAVRFDFWKYDNRERQFLSLGILSQSDGAWSLSDILVRGTETLVGRQDLLSYPMTEAAKRHGAKLDRYTLRGALTAQGLLALLKDGQFTTGLKVDRQSSRYYALEDAARGGASEPR